MDSKTVFNFSNPDFSGRDTSLPCTYNTIRDNLFEKALVLFVTHSVTHGQM